MGNVTPKEALAHPNWSMGAKISIDCATMMNKGLELIEAARLFPVDPRRIEVVIHRQSIIHSLVDYVDGSMLAQLGPSDMRTPIAHTLAWPDRMQTPMAPLDLVALGRLDFEAADELRFPALALARTALLAGGARPAVLNAANEVAVEAFLAERIRFLDIALIVAKALERYDPPEPQNLGDVLVIDSEARVRAREVMERQAA
jgi:1-deoxy-D-xylulose-5-phosphate reductoisomerase